VFGQAFDDYSGDAEIGTEVGAGAFGVLFGKLPHGF
jgi:hypothetical protein